MADAAATSAALSTSGVSLSGGIFGAISQLGQLAASTYIQKEQQKTLQKQADAQAAAVKPVSNVPQTVAVPMATQTVPQQVQPAAPTSVVLNTGAASGSGDIPWKPILLIVGGLVAALIVKNMIAK